MTEIVKIPRTEHHSEVTRWRLEVTALISRLATEVTDPGVDLYLYNLAATPALTDDAVIGGTQFTVADTTGVVIGHAITVYEADRVFQSLVIGTTATTIDVGSPIDYAFSEDALIETGAWDMAVDGSITPQTYYIKGPPLREIDIHTVNHVVLDGTAMDDGTFGGLPALTSGIIYGFSRATGEQKTLVLLINNGGFYEIGFETSYSSKAPAGTYGFRARRNIPTTNGNVIRLKPGDTFFMTIRDDLSGLTQMANTINGHSLTP